MRLFAVACLAIAVYYGYTAIEAMRTGATTALSGSSAVQQRDVAGSHYQKFLTARWLVCGGFIAMAVVMQINAGRFDKLMAGPKPGDDSAPK